MNRYKRLFAGVFALLFPLLASAQSAEWDMQFRESGKIYVVVAVALLILLVLLGYMIKQDRSLSRLEKQINEKS